VRKGKRLKDDPMDKQGIMVNYNDVEVDTDGRNSTPDLYGPLWLTITYIILLIICANLNDYFISGNDQYIFNTDYGPPIIGIVLIFTIAEGLVYKSVIGCLKGAMLSAEVKVCFNPESMSSWILPDTLLYTDYILRHSFSLCTYNRLMRWWASKGTLSLSKLW